MELELHRFEDGGPSAEEPLKCEAGPRTDPHQHLDEEKRNWPDPLDVGTGPAQSIATTQRNRR